MKILILFVCLSFFPLLAAGQSSINIKVEYVHTVGQNEQQVTYPHYLFLSGSKSYYLIKLSQDDRPALKKVEKEDGTLHFDVVVKSPEDSGVFHDPKRGEMISNVPLFDKMFLVEEPTPAISWSITGNTRVIAEHECHEALGEFRGRKYSAWFTPDIPVSAGPYKFGGLPGLILQVNEQKGGFNWYCKSIGKISSEDALIVRRPVKGESVTFHEFYDLIITSIKRRIASMEANGNVTVGELRVNTDEWLERIK